MLPAPPADEAVRRAPTEYIEYPTSWVVADTNGIGSGSRTRLLGGSAGSADPTTPVALPVPAHPFFAKALESQQPLHVVVRGRCPRLPTGVHSSAAYGGSTLGPRALVTGQLFAFDRRGTLTLTDVTERAWRLEPLALEGNVAALSKPAALKRAAPPLSSASDGGDSGLVQLPARGTNGRAHTDGLSGDGVKGDALTATFPAVAAAAGEQQWVGEFIDYGDDAEDSDLGDVLRSRRERLAARRLLERQLRAADAERNDPTLAVAGEDMRTPESGKRVGTSSDTIQSPQGEAVWVVRERRLGHLVVRCTCVVAVAVGPHPSVDGLGPALEKRVRGTVNEVTGNVDLTCAGVPVC